MLSAPARAIPRADRSGVLPLSFSQARLWFLDQYSPGEVTYNIPLVIDLDGPLDVEALREALSDIVGRHEALRTIFPSSRGVPAQVVLAAEPLALPMVDLSGLEPGLRDAQLDELLGAESQRAYDLARGPIFRAHLIRLSAERHVLVAGVHHIVYDGWSNGIVFGELTTLYEAYASGKPSPLEAPSVQLVDYVVWQRDRLQGDLLRTEIDYWKAHLAGAPRLSLPTDFPRPTVRSGAGGREHTLIPEEIVGAIDAFGRRDGATLFITLLTAYAALLQAFCRQDDLVIGTPFANRPRRELESVVGFFLNMLPLRVDLSGALTFRDALKRVKQVALSAYTHQDLPFEKLVEELRPERSLDRTPVIETAFVVDNNPRAVGQTIVLGDLRLRRRLIESGTAKFDLTLAMFRRDGGRRVSLEYRKDLFERTTAARLLRQYELLLHRVVDHPDATLVDLLRADPSDIRVEAATQGRRTTYPRDATIAQIFEAQVRQHPQALAVVRGDEQLAYADLETRANRLAHWLRRRGVKPGALVGVCLERSVDTIVALLAIGKAGGAYVPLDPAYPCERLALLAERAAIDVLVTTSALAAATGLQPELLVRLDLDRHQIDECTNVAPEGVGAADDLAYVLFTSGTTGEPKMVGVPHRAIARLAFGMPDIPSGDGARVLHAAPLAFDASTFEIWAPLLRGGCVVVSPHDLPTPFQLEHCIRTHRVTMLWLTASLFNLVIDERPQALSGVSHVLTGGEALSVDHVERALVALPETAIVNGYGPTEATTFATYYVVARGGRRLPSVPIGRPLDNTVVYILDEAQRPVAPGLAGELWIGGDALAVGYIGDPRLTAERFRPDPFEGGSARMYRSGDRARHLPDGTIEFLGRLDDQFKLRGFRIEPGEIETAMARHPQIERAAVGVHELPGLGRTLVGYYVAAAGPVPLASELRTFLRARLPQHMVPAFFEPLARLPLKANGKLDRRSLPPPSRTSGTEPTSAPGLLTPAEEQVARVWRDVLRVARIDRDSHFFDLGGDSLRAAQAMSRLGELAGHPLPVRALFEFPTVTGLATLFEAHLATPVTAPTHLTSPEGPATRHAPPLQDRPGGAGDQATDFAPGELEAVLADIWRSLLNVGHLDIDDDFFEVGGHSLLAVRLVSEVESRLGVTLPPMTLFQHGTIRRQAALLRHWRAEPEWSPLVAIQPRGSRPPLFLVHGIGGEVLSYGPLARHLGDDQPLYGLRARTQPENGVWPSVEQIARSYVQAVRRQTPTGPYRIGGYSGGGLIAYEMACQLTNAGEIVDLLVMIDRPAFHGEGTPSLRGLVSWPRRARYWLLDDDLLRAGARNAIGRVRSKLIRGWHKVSRRIAPARTATMDIRHALGVWRYPDDSREFLTELNRSLKAYQPQPYPGSILVIRSRSGRLFSAIERQPDLGWGALVSGRVATEVVPAAHDTLIMEPRVRHLADAIRRHLGS